jgi:hypothetical protein
MGFPSAGNWLGEGSLSMLAQISGAPGDLKLDSFDLTAAALHATGALDWTHAGAAPPMLTGHVTADTLPLPGFAPHDSAPLPLAWLTGFNAGLDLSAGLVLVGNAEMLHDAHASLNLAAGVLKLDGLKATLGGGPLTGAAQLDSASTPPRATAAANVAGASLTGGLFGSTLDLESGRIDASANLAGQGFSPASLLASLSGTVQLAASAGTLTGLDVAAGAAGGTSRVDTLHLTAGIADGTVTLQQTAMTGPDGATAFSGTIDLPGAAMDVLATLPQGRDLRLSGGLLAPK